jgi:HK97 gp10 family phage protein
VANGIKVKLEIPGIQDMRKMLEALPRRVRKKALKAGVTAGAGPIVKAAKRDAPTQSKTLKKGITKKVRAYSNGNAIAIIGENRATAGTYKGKRRVPQFYWHLIIGGTKPHDIQINKGPMAGRTVHHPGANSNPFFHNAVARTKAASGAAMKKKITDVVEAEAKKAAMEGKR